MLSNTRHSICPLFSVAPAEPKVATLEWTPLEEGIISTAAQLSTFPFPFSQSQNCLHSKVEDGTPTRGAAGWLFEKMLDQSGCLVTQRPRSSRQALEARASLFPDMVIPPATLHHKRNFDEMLSLKVDEINSETKKIRTANDFSEEVISRVKNAAAGSTPEPDHDANSPFILLGLEPPNSCLNLSVVPSHVSHSTHLPIGPLHPVHILTAMRSHIRPVSLDTDSQTGGVGWLDDPSIDLEGLAQSFPSPVNSAFGVNEVSMPAPVKTGSHTDSVKSKETHPVSATVSPSEEASQRLSLPSAGVGVSPVGDGLPAPQAKRPPSNSQFAGYRIDSHNIGASPRPSPGQHSRPGDSSHEPASYQQVLAAHIVYFLYSSLSSPSTRNLSFPIHTHMRGCFPLQVRDVITRGGGIFLP
jgi:hypothetical protein